MFYVYGQLPLQTLLIVLDATFWILTYFLVEFLSIINNPSTQVASVITSLGGFWRFLYHEILRTRMRKTKINDYELDPLSAPRAGSITSEEYLSKDQFDFKPETSGYRVSTAEISDPTSTASKGTGNHDARLYATTIGHKTFHYPTLFIFFICIICTTYGSKVLNLILSQNVAPSAEQMYLSVYDASKKVLNSTTDTSSLIPSNFDINTRWPSDEILYNINVNYHKVDQFENKIKRIHLNETGFGNSFFLMGGILFSFEEGPGSHVMCGSSDKWTEIVMKKGSEVLELNLPSVPIFPQPWCLNSTHNDTAVSINYADFKFQSDHMSAPGDNITLFGIDRQNRYIYANTIIYESSNFTQRVMQDIYDDLDDVPVSSISSLFDHLGCDLSLENYNVMFNSDNNQTSYDVSSNITEGIETFINAWFDSDVSFTLGFTVKDNSTVNSTEGTLYNRVLISYHRVYDQVTVTQALYRGRLLGYKIVDPLTFVSIHRWNSSISTPMYYANVQLLPMVVNIKTTPFVFGVICKIFGIFIDEPSIPMFSLAGKLRYNVTSIVCSILAVFGLSLFLCILCKIILRKKPQGIPSYYGLLHQYHEKQLNVQRPLDAKVERQSIFKIIDKAYEGVGYDANLRRRRVGVLDETTYKDRVNNKDTVNSSLL